MESTAQFRPQLSLSIFAAIPLLLGTDAERSAERSLDVLTTTDPPKLPLKVVAFLV